MPIRIYDISVKLGLENKEVLSKAKMLGIAAAKVPSSSLDKISGEWLESELLKDHPELETKFASPIAVVSSPAKPQITITAKGAELYWLVKRILNDEIQLHFNIAESDNSEPLRVYLVKDASIKPTEETQKSDLLTRVEIDERTKDILRAAYYVSRHKAVDGWLNLAEYGNAVKQQDPTFQPQKFGEKSLGSLMRRIDIFELRNDESNPIVYYLRMKEEKSKSPTPNPIQIPIVPVSLKLVRGKIHNLRLGFGFIMPDDGSENAFFHATDIEGCTIFDLKPGDAVEYEPGTNEKGPCARKSIV
jgi:cold shock CspA family protein